MNYDMAMVVGTSQPKGKMVKALLEPDAKLSTPLTQDITAWSLPHAYGLDAIASTATVSAHAAHPFTKTHTSLSSPAAGYLVTGNSLDDEHFLAGSYTA